MGGKGSKSSAKGIDFDEWQNLGQFHDTTVMKSNKGNGQAQMNSIILDPRFDIDKQMEIYSYRKNQNSALIKCLGAEPNKGKKTTMCGNQNGFKVLTERIPKRWNQIQQISFPESIYALSQSLAGYEDLYSKAGLFQISSTMMGINNEGQMKVWLNENFAQNHPSDEKPVLQTTSSSPQQFGTPSSEASMVRNIIEIIESKTEAGRFPQDFKNLSDSNFHSFQEAQDAIQNYAQERSLFIPSRLNKKYINSHYNGPNLNSNYNSNLNAVNSSNLPAFQYNTNRFTYQTNRNDEQLDKHQTTSKFASQYKNSDANSGKQYHRPVTYQANQFETNSGHTGNAYNYSLPNTNIKKYTYVGDNNTDKLVYEPKQSSQVGESVALQNNNRDRNTIVNKQTTYTTYGNQHTTDTPSYSNVNNRHQPEYQNETIATSQVTKQY